MIIRALTTASLSAEIVLMRPSESSDRRVMEVVAGIITRVRAGGDAAVAEAPARLDWPGAEAGNSAVPAGDIEAALASADAGLIEALRTTRDNCTFFHRHEIIPDLEVVGPQGQVLGIRRVPVRRAGLYVPGGVGSYASTVIMNSVPAQVAGVEELIICTPPGRDGGVNPSVLTAAALMGIGRVFRVGGAQAVAAMAYGTESIPRVDVICGPGNAYVTEAKRQVYGAVGIDGLAGPSEVLILADHSARPEWIAADLLAQEEHGSGAQGVLFAESEDICRETLEALGRMRGADAADAAVEGPGADRLWAFYPTVGEDFCGLAAAFVEEYAPEHLELQLADARGFLERVRSAGAVFLGHFAPTAYGDYVAGSNHVLPTGGSARFASSLSVDTFMRKSSYVEMSPEAVRALTPALAGLADSEGFRFHRLSAQLRASAKE